MKRLDAFIVTLIVLNFLWFGWRIYQANHAPSKLITSVSPKEIIGKRSNLIGTSNSGYTLIEFGDYQCPPCARMFHQIEEFMEQHEGAVQFQFRHYPLPSHKYAFPASIIAEQARSTGNFQSVHNQLYSHDAKLDETVLNDIALRNKLNYSAEEGLSPTDTKSAEIVHTDKEVGNKIPIQGTPSLFLCTPDQKIYQLVSVEQVKDFIR